MIIEATLCEVLNYLYQRGYLACPCYAEEPEEYDRPEAYHIIELTGEDGYDHVWTASMTIQTYGRTLLEASKLAKELRNAIRYLNEYGLDNEELEMYPGYGDVGGLYVDTQYNWTDESTKRYRYQTIIEVSYMEQPLMPFSHWKHDENAPFRAAIVGTARTGIDRI